jgi:chromatin modification-related protein YNG2
MSIDEQDVDAEGEYEVDESIQEIEAEDDTVYCTCGQQSHGEMIGCDNDNCPIQWVSFLFLSP